MKAKKLLLALLGAAAFIALLTWLTLGSSKVRIEACMEHRGQTSCRVAAASTEAEATRTAIDNACATIAFGVTENGQCTRSTPLSVRRLN